MNLFVFRRRLHAYRRLGTTGLHHPVLLRVKRNLSYDSQWLFSKYNDVKYMAIRK